MKRLPLLLASVAMLLTSAAPAMAVTIFTADLDQLNGSNAFGNAILTLDEAAQTLRVQLLLANAEPNQPHGMHIHGRFNPPATPGGTPLNSTNPTLAQDDDGDGFIEVLEGVETYGDIILPLSSPPASNNDPNTITPPVANSFGIVLLDETYDLTDEGQFFSGVTGSDYSAADLFPLNFREIVVHGRTVATGQGAGTPGEVDGTGGYKALLPIASGEIVGIPEPATCSLAGLGLLGLLAARRRR